MTGAGAHPAHRPGRLSSNRYSENRSRLVTSGGSAWRPRPSRPRLSCREGRAWSSATWSPSCSPGCDVPPLCPSPPWAAWTGRLHAPRRLARRSWVAPQAESSPGGSRPPHYGAPTLYLPHLPGASTLAGWSGDASHFPVGGLAEPRVKCCWVSSGAPQNGDGFSHPRAALTMSACRPLRWPRTEGKGAWWPIGRGPRRPQPGVPSRAGILLVTFRCRLGGSGPGTLHFQLASWRCWCRWSGSVLARAQQVESWERVAYGVSSHVPKMQMGTPVSWGCG